MQAHGPRPDSSIASSTDDVKTAADLRALWGHIYGEATGYVAIFSGLRFDGDLEGVNTEYYFWPTDVDQAVATVVRRAGRGREVYHSAPLLTEARRRKANAAQVRALYPDDGGAQAPAEVR